MEMLEKMYTGWQTSLGNVSEVLGRLREMAGPYMVAALSW